MNKLNKVIIVCLIAILCLLFAGCSDGSIKNESSEPSSSIVNGDKTADDDTGIELPEDEFDTTEQSGTSGSNTNTSNNKTTQSSDSGNSQNESSLAESTDSTSSVTESTDDNQSSADENVEDNTSSDDVSQPVQNDDGSIELPFDEW